MLQVHVPARSPVVDPIAYTRYSFFEWALIILDVLYDSSAELDFKAADLKVSQSAILEAENILRGGRGQITIGTLVGGSSEADKMYQQLHRLA